MATVSCGERAAGEGGALVADGGLALKISSNKTKRGASGHAAADRIAKRRIAATNQAGPGVAQHRGQFARGLARVHRNGDESFGDNREIERGPADAVRSDQRAAVALRKSRSAQEGARGGDLREQVRACRGSIASRVRFGQHHAAGGFLQFRENIFEEVHGVLSSTGFSLWIFGAEQKNPHRLKPVLRNSHAISQANPRLRQPLRLRKSRAASPDSG